MHTRHAVVRTNELGDVTLVAADANLVGVYFPAHWTKPDRTGFGAEVESTTDPVLSEASRQLHEYLRGERTSFDLPTVAAGSEFEERIWALLHEIPYGQTSTYGALAESLGNTALARRVGQAVGRNPLSIVVGCHRVVGKRGELRGYAGGLRRKRFLLDLEGRAGGAGRLRRHDPR